MDNCPGHARRAAKKGKNKEPRHEHHEDIGGPHPWIREPLCVPVQIRRWHRPHIHSSSSFFFLKISILVDGDNDKE